MNVLEIELQALNLPEDDRARLAAQLLSTLPAVLSDADDGSEEANRRITEMKRDSSVRRRWDEIRAEIGR